MVLTRARARADQSGRPSLALSTRARESHRVYKGTPKKTCRRRLGPRSSPKRSIGSPPKPPLNPSEPSPIRQTPLTSSRKRLRDSQDTTQRCSDSRVPKRSRTSAAATPEESYDRADEVDPLAHWVQKGHCPPRYTEQDANMEHALARKRFASTVSRKRSAPSSASSVTPSDQKSRAEKSAPYRDPRYKILLETKGVFMAGSPLGVTDQSKDDVSALLTSQQTVPNDSLFRGDLFEKTCQKVEDGNEARVVRDINPLIVPSAEILATYGANELECLIESTNEGWNNSLPLTGTRPQPDYSTGFRRDAFTEDQLEKLSPFIGGFITGDQSLFMGTYYIYFPFLTCEVKCGVGGLDVADRQNAHSMALAVRAIVELFRLVKREDDLHRQFLAFSISHDHRSVRIYGHYPVITKKDTKYYRHQIRTFDFTDFDGKEKWTAYQFTKNVYELWMPIHFKKICSAIDQLPSYLDFDIPPLSGTGLSQGLESHHLSQSDADSVSIPIEQDSQLSNASQDGATPDTPLTEPGSKRRKWRGKVR